MALEYKNYYVSYPGSVKIDAALPIDIRTVVSSSDALYGSEAASDQTWKQAYNGLIVSVIDSGLAYMCINSADPYKAESWKCLGDQSKIDASIIQLQQEINDISINRVSSIDGTVLSDYIQVNTNSSRGDVKFRIDLSIGDVANDIDGLATTQDVKKYVDNVSVDYTLNSTSPYILTTTSIDPSGRTISSSVSVITTTLENARNGSIGLATAEDVYNNLFQVEKTVASAFVATAKTLGFREDFSVQWSTASGIPATDTYKEAIERVQTEVQDQWVEII